MDTQPIGGQQMEQQKSSKRTVFSVIIAIIIVIIIAYALWSSKASAPAIGEVSGKKEVKNMKEVAAKGDIVSMNYTGKLTDGTVFDSNVDPKFKHVEPFEFTLGVGQVILGWDEGIVGMKVGEKKTLTISPEKAYGTRGQGPIPPNATLVFDVELVSIK
jgi:FKBP-type peptidyl-prolyl cis-trans isomerase FkpA